jgi:hygromycin-B 4-O-kinase
VGFGTIDGVIVEMNQSPIGIRQAQVFLASYLGNAAVNVSLIGEGAWSRCYGFRRGDEDLVIRFGKYVSDFEKDRRAYGYASPDLPIPQVVDIGQAFDGYYAISTRAYGVPLESLDEAQWLSIVPAVASVLEAMRTTDLSSSSGFGGWGTNGNAPHHSWSSRLLAVNDDTPDQRGHGWRERLAAFPQGEETFAWGFDLLKSVVDDAVPRCLLHCDLVNGNVLVNEGQITGVFDWGCSVYGDHLYDLAWFEFWAPWFPRLDMRYLRSELERRWDEIGYAPEHKEPRLLACYLHIGLEHLSYNAYLGDWSNLSATAKRMRTLITGAFAQL